MAGAVGIEPTNGGFKGPCLTAWLRPKVITINDSQFTINKRQLIYYKINSDKKKGRNWTFLGFLI